MGNKRQRICNTDYATEGGYHWHLWTRPTLERRVRLGRLISINPKMITPPPPPPPPANNHRPANFWKIWNHFFKHWKETVKIGAIKLRLHSYRKSISIIEMVISIYINIHRYMSSCWHHILAIYRAVYRKFTDWAILELSIRRRIPTLLISWGQKTRVNTVILIYRHDISSGL